MNSLLSYLLQVIAISGILYLYYHVALRNKKFHLYNRFYLLGAIIASILIPFLNIPVYFTAQETESSLVLQTLSTFYPPGTEDILSPVIEANATPAEKTDPVNYLYYGYLLLSLIVLARIIFSLLKIRRLSKTYPIEKIGDIKFVNTEEPGTPFSFFRWLFWNRRIELNSDKGEQVFRHELYHIRQRHSVDIIIAELSTVIFWINPFFHIIKKELRAIHEFLADRFAVTETGKWDYAELLLMQALQTKQHLVHPFFQTQIKRRIAMIIHPQKTSFRYLRKLLVLPLAIVLFTVFAFKYKNVLNNQVVPAKENITVVIDAAHGGIDPGANSPEGDYSEAQLSLQLAKKVSELAAEYNVTVVMTRTEDILPGNASTKQDGLRKRVEIADKSKPAAFISLHVNATGNKNFQERYSGINAYVSNNKNDLTSRQVANALLTELSGIYKTSKDPLTRNDAGIWVLDKNTCPSVAIECGYIDNKKDLSFITHPENQEKLARAILKGVVRAAEHGNLSNTTPIDTIPRNTISVKISQSTPGFNITVEDLITKGTLHQYKETPELIIVNNEKCSIEQIKQKYNGTVVTRAEMVTIPANDADAIKKYGEVARKGVIIFSNASFKDQSSIKFMPVDVQTASGFKQAFFVLDNVPLDKNYEEILQNLPADTIQSINVLKPPTSIEKYAERGEHGVIEIFTKNYGGLVSGKAVTDTVKLGNRQLMKEREIPLLTHELLVRDRSAEPSNVDIPPAFPGGEDALKNYLEQNLDVSIPISQKAPPGYYTIFVQFAVSRYGTVTGLKPLSKYGYGMEQEAMRVIEKGPGWKPAIKDGHIVDAFKAIGITFHIPRPTAKGTANLAPIEVEGYALNSQIQNLINVQRQRQQEVREIKDIAKNDIKVAYTYKGRTYLFLNDEATRFFETDGIDHSFFIDGTIYESIDKINEQLKRYEITSNVKVISPIKEVITN